MRDLALPLLPGVEGSAMWPLCRLLFAGLSAFLVLLLNLSSPTDTSHSHRVVVSIYSARFNFVRIVAMLSLVFPQAQHWSLFYCLTTCTRCELTEEEHCNCWGLVCKLVTLSH